MKLLIYDDYKFGVLNGDRVVVQATGKDAEIAVQEVLAVLTSQEPI